MNEDGTLNAPSNPAKLGSVVSIRATATGPVFSPSGDGEVQVEARDDRCCQVTVLEGRSAEAPYAGAAPGIVAGVTQINFRVPLDLAIEGTQAVEALLSVPGDSMNLPAQSAFWIYVTP